MRYLILSDIHANAVAFEAVLKHAERKRWDQVIFLGDVVGYYTQPEPATTMLRELEPGASLLGNHDALMLSLKQEGIEAGLREESLVTGILTEHLEQLSGDNLAFVGSFEQRVRTDAWEAVHGALRSPWEYLRSLAHAQANLPLMSADLCFVGHTHIPIAFACVSDGERELWRAVQFRLEHAVYRLPPKARVFFNPGSVGQPRDGIPLASYAIFDAGLRTIELFRVPFDIPKVRRLVVEQGYPELLGARLETGQ